MKEWYLLHPDIHTPLPVPEDEPGHPADEAFAQHTLIFGSDVKCPSEIGLCISSHHGGNSWDLFSPAWVQF